MTTQIPLRVFSSRTISRTITPTARPCQSLLDSRIYLLYRPVRSYSTPSSPPPLPDAPKPIDLRSQLNTSQVASEDAPPPKAKRSLRSYIYATLFLMVGLTAGQYMRFIVSPPPLPVPGSKEDKMMVEFITKQAEKLPLVKALSEDPNWTYHDAYSGVAPEEREHRLGTGPLGGSRAIGGFQRIFYHAESGECVTVIWFGGAVAGWPLVTHGGVIATILDESLGRCAVRKLPGNTGVTATLELNYRNPLITNAFYVVRALPQEDGSTDSKQWVNGQLETPDGKVCVEARGLFVVPKKYKTAALPQI